MKYCENCKLLLHSESCEICGSRQIREAKADDFCFLLECERTFGDVLGEALEDAGIRCASVPCGTGVRTALGLNLEGYRIYVPFEFYETAKDMVTFFTVDPTDDLRRTILEHQDQWHTKNASVEKKIRKRLKLNRDDAFFDRIKNAVETAEVITDEGTISNCPRSGRYLFVKTDGKYIGFNSVTFEIFL
jgi:hypothetical protein